MTAELVPANPATPSATAATAPKAVAGMLDPNAVEDRIAVAPQWKLIWWRFRKHKLAVGGTIVLVLFYFVSAFADFFAYVDPSESDAQRSLIAPQTVYWFDDGKFAPFVHPLKGSRDPMTFKRVYVPDESRKVPITFFGHGEPYNLFGFIPTDRHLIAVEGAKP